MSAGLRDGLKPELQTEPALAQLNACLVTLLTEVRELRREADPTAPMTAVEMCRRWNIAGETDEARLFNLARRCREYGLRPLKKSRGWEALYRRADVLAAEEFAAGISKRRRAA